MDRRTLIKQTASATGMLAGMSIAQSSAVAQATSEKGGAEPGRTPEMIYRPLGRTGEKVPAIGMGGH